MSATQNLLFFSPCPKRFSNFSQLHLLKKLNGKNLEKFFKSYAYSAKFDSIEEGKRLKSKQ